MEGEIKVAVEVENITGDTTTTNTNSNTSDKIIKTVLYVIAMQEESSAILDQDNFVKDESFCKEYSNILESFTCPKEDDKGNKYTAIIVRPLNDPLHSTGLFGTEIAFFQSYVAIKFYNPDVVISMGYAGEVAIEGEESKLQYGSVVIAKEKSIYHRREMIVKFFENTSKGHYPLHSSYNLVKELGFDSCSVGTSNSFVRHDHIASKNSIQVVEMELCSVARACYYFQTPCIGVKIISDTPNNLTEEERMKQFLDALPTLRGKFFETYTKINSYLYGKNIKDI